MFARTVRSPRPSFRLRRRIAARPRRGAVVIECAIALPLIFLLTFATLEVCSAIFVRQTLKTIAFEGCRIGVRRRATQTDVEAACNELLAARGIANGQCEVTPNDFSGLRALDPITVTVSAPAAGNSWFLYQFFGSSQLSTTVKMVREFDE